MAANEGKSARILAAIKAGCETVNDIEAELDFTIPKLIIAAHVQNLKQRGKIIKVGEVVVQHDCIRLGKDQVAGYRAAKYQVAVDQGGAAGVG